MHHSINLPTGLLFFITPILSRHRHDMSGKLKTKPQTQEESSGSAASDEGKASSTFSLSCNIPQNGIIPCKGLNAPQETECSVTTGRQTRCTPQHEDDSSADVLTSSTFERANTKCTGSPQARSTDLSRKNLMVLIQIMLKYLNNNDRNLRVEVKKAVADCTKKNREGHPDYRFLVDSIMSRLRLLVGDMHWSQLENLMEHYRKNHKRISAKSDSVHKFVAV